MRRREGGVSGFSIEGFLSHSAENLSREFFTVALISGTEKVWIRGGVSRFPVKIFCLTVPKIFVGESVTVALISGSEKVWIGGRGGGGIKIFIEGFLSHSRENLSRESFTVALIPGTEKVWIRGGVSRYYDENFLSQSRKSS